MEKMKTYRKRPLFLFFLCICCFIFLTFFCLLYGRVLQELQNQTLIIDRGFAYITLQHESDPTQLPQTQESLDGFDELFARLTENQQKYTYYEIYRQPLFMDGDQHESIQISNNVISDFSLEINIGRGFRQEDFSSEKENPIPIILGSDLKDSYNLNDEFWAQYLYEDYLFKVIGFLSPGSQIQRSTGTINLDSYYVMPSVEFTYRPTTETQYISQIIHRANKTSGKIRVSPENLQEVKNFVLDILEQSQVGEFSCSSSILSISPSYIIIFSAILLIGLFIVVIKIIWVLIKSIRSWVIIGSIIVMGSISKVAFSVATDLKISVFLLQTVALCLVLLVPIIIGSVRLKHQSN